MPDVDAERYDRQPRARHTDLLHQIVGDTLVNDRDVMRETPIDPCAQPAGQAVPQARLRVFGDDDASDAREPGGYPQLVQGDQVLQVDSIQLKIAQTAYQAEVVAISPERRCRWNPQIDDRQAVGRASLAQRTVDAVNRGDQHIGALFGQLTGKFQSHHLRTAYAKGVEDFQNAQALRRCRHVRGCHSLSNVRSSEASSNGLKSRRARGGAAQLSGARSPKTMAVRKFTQCYDQSGRKHDTRIVDCRHRTQ